MKYTLFVALLFSAIISKAVIFYPYAGVALTKGKISSFKPTQNYIAGVRLDHQLPGGIQLGIGADIQRMAYRDNITYTDINGAPYYKAENHLVGDPAYSLYFHAGYRIRIKKFSIIPGLSAGGTYAQGGGDASGKFATYPNSLGYLLGGNLGIEYGFKRLAIHAEFMPRYYKQSYEKDMLKDMELMSYPLTLGVALKI